MLATMEYVDILDQSDHLSNMIIQSEVMQAYKQVRLELHKDAEAQALIQDFNNIKQDYDDVQRFGRYHPDYNEIMKKVRAAKRKMDMHDKVAAFKIAERNLQNLLDEISELIAHSVSDHIMVPKDGALFTDSSCSGGCGSGGSCSCQAS